MPDNIPQAPVGQLRPYEAPQDAPKAPVGNLRPYDGGGVPKAPVGQLKPYQQPQETEFERQNKGGIGSYIPDSVMPALNAISKYAVEPFEWMANKGRQAGEAVMGMPDALYNQSMQGAPDWAKGPAEGIRGVEKAVGGTLGSMQADPRQWPLALSPGTGLAGRAMGAGFGGQMAVGAYEQGKDTAQNWDTSTIGQKAQGIAQTGIDALFGLGGLHGSLMPHGGVPAHGGVAETTPDTTQTGLREKSPLLIEQPGQRTPARKPTWTPAPAAERPFKTVQPPVKPQEAVKLQATPQSPQATPEAPKAPVGKLTPVEAPKPQPETPRTPVEASKPPVESPKPPAQKPPVLTKEAKLEATRQDRIKAKGEAYRADPNQVASDQAILDQAAAKPPAQKAQKTETPKKPSGSPSETPDNRVGSPVGERSEPPRYTPTTKSEKPLESPPIAKSGDSTKTPGTGGPLSATEKKDLAATQSKKLVSLNEAGALEQQVRAMPGVDSETVNSLKSAVYKQAKAQGLSSGEFGAMWHKTLERYRDKVLAPKPPSTDPDQAGSFSLGGVGKSLGKSIHRAANNPTLPIEKVSEAVSKIKAPSVDKRIEILNKEIPLPDSRVPHDNLFSRMRANTAILWDWYKNAQRTGMSLSDAFAKDKNPQAYDAKPDYWKTVGRQEQSHQLVSQANQQYVRSIQKAFSQESLHAINMHIDTGGDLAKLASYADNKDLHPMLRRAAKLATDLTPEERNAADKLKQYYDESRQEATKAGVISHFLEDYLPHFFDMTTKKGAEAVDRIMTTANNGMINTKLQNAWQRQLGDLAEANLKTGLLPKGGADYTASKYGESLNRAIFSKATLKELHNAKLSDGITPLMTPDWNSIRPILPAELEANPVLKEAVLGDKKARDAFAEAYFLKAQGGPKGPMLPTSLMDAYGIKYDKATMRESSEKARMDLEKNYAPIEHRAFNKNIYAGSINGKPVFYEAKTWVHKSALADVRALYERNHLADSPTMKNIQKINSMGKTAVLGALPSGFHYNQEWLHYMGHAGLAKALKDLPKVWSGDAVKLDALHKNTVEGMAHGLKLFDYETERDFGRTAGASGSISAAASAHLWQFVAGLKATLYPHQFELNKKTYLRKGYTMDQLHNMTARQVNNAFGLQNEIWHGRSKTISGLFRLASIAPDFLESRLRFTGQALMPGGKYQRHALIRQGMYMWTAARVLNSLANNGDAKWDGIDAFRLHLGGKVYDVRSVLTDSLHMASDPWKFFGDRASPILRPAIAGAKAGVRRPKGDTWWSATAENLIKEVTPIALQGALSSTFRKYVEGKHGKLSDVAFESYKSFMEGMFGIRTQREQDAKGY